MTPPVRFSIQFDSLYRILSTALLLTPSRSFVEIDRDEIRVRMGWAFRARFPRTAAVSAVEYGRKPLSRGVHGWAGTWLVNGSGKGIVSITVEPRQRAYLALGVPVELRNLLVSVEDPGSLIAALTS
jgi:hypothetical protein